MLGKNIYIVGMMGVGKSTHGKLIAKALNYSFVDLDEYIEKAYCKTISEIFSDKGEAEFRVMETKCLEEVLKNTHTVVATGGGTPCFYNNMAKMKANGYTLFLRLGINEIARRLMESKKVRPALVGMDLKAIEKFVHDKIEERAQVYDMAEWEIEMKFKYDKADWKNFLVMNIPDLE